MSASAARVEKDDVTKESNIVITKSKLKSFLFIMYNPSIVYILSFQNKAVNGKRLYLVVVLLFSRRILCLTGAVERLYNIKKYALIKEKK